MNFTINGGNQNAEIALTEKLSGDILYLNVDMKMPEAEIPEKFSVTWFFSAKDIASTWNPSLQEIHGLFFDWGKKTIKSRLASWMPEQQLISRTGKNRLNIAVSDVDTPIEIGTGIREEDATFICQVTFFTLPTSPRKNYSAVIRLDMRDIPYYDSIYDVSDWWENECGYKPAHVPEAARQPMDSLWYSFHQMLDKDEIIKECRHSKELGMETVIIDDGWQTDDNNRGYAFCGDWEVAENKMGSMAQLVENLHAEGMKVMLWYSVPFMGIYSKNYDRFKNMLLDESGDNKTFFALDPRYKEVRSYLCDVYETAVREWKLDGLKLDFIDSFILKGKSLNPDPARDYQSLEDAIHALMAEIKSRLTKLNPEILIEFRQSYVGPSIRKYGNMLRVGDCPCDILKNRFNIVNLRLTSGKTAVHSDMIMWSYEDTAENAALQFASILYGVPQISMRIDRLPKEHCDMLRHYISFWKEWREVLLDGKLTATNPECEYSLVCSELNDKAVFTAYSDTVIPVKTKETAAVNATAAESLIIKNASGYNYAVTSCTGEKLSEGTISSDLEEIRVPIAGMIILKACDK